MQYQIVKEGKPVAEFTEETDAKKFLTEKQEEYVRDMYLEWLHAYMEEHGIRYPGYVTLAEVDGVRERFWDESKNVFQLNDSSADKDVYADKLVEKITPIFEEAKDEMDIVITENATVREQKPDVLLNEKTDFPFLRSNNEEMKLTEQQIHKISLNEKENDLFREQLNKYFNNQMLTHEVINVCSTPNILKILNSSAKRIILSQSDLENAISDASSGKKNHREGHGIAQSELYKLSDKIRSPIMILKGNKRNFNSLVLLTEMKNKKGEYVFIPISLDRQGKKVSNISTLYGKKNIPHYLSTHLSDILAINIEKADVLANIGIQFPKSFCETLVCFNDRIAYTTENVKYPFKNLEKNNYKNKQKKQIEEITERLEQGITKLFSSERYKEYLRVMSKFHNYSFNNTLLIAMQSPGATHVTGYTKWKKDFKRNIKKGEKGIRILAPAPYKIQQQVEKKDPQTGKTVIGMDGQPVMETREVQIPAFKVVSVFDVSQTEGRELPAPAVSELAGDVEQYEDFYAALEKTSPVPMSFEKIEGRSHGYYHLEEKRIAIAEGMSELQNLKTAIHEIAHAKLHDIDLDAPQEEQTDRPDRSTREVQAESIAYTVCQHYGLDTSGYSFGYIAEWSSGRELAELKSSLETIRTTAAEIIGSIDGHFAELQKQRETEKEPAKEEMQPEQSEEENFPTPDPNAEPVVTIIWSEHSRFHDGETMSLSEANAVIGSLDEAAAKEDGCYYYKTKFRIDFVMDGNPDCYVGRQDLGDGDGTLIDHIEKYHASFENNEQWDNYLLRNGNTEALEADKAQRDMLLHEFVPYLKLHDNLFKQEQAAITAIKALRESAITAIKAVQGNNAMTSTETACRTACQTAIQEYQEYISKCRTMVNSGDYDLLPAPQLKDYDTVLEAYMEQAYKEHVEEEIAQEAAAAGMTVEEYAANGYESYKTELPEKVAKEQEEVVDNIRGNEDYYRYFYAGEQDRQAENFARENGWKKIWAGDSQGMNGDTWIVYREISDLPKFLREYAEGQERSADRAAAQTQTEHCKDKGSWAAMIENRKNAVSEKESNAAAREQKPDIHKGKNKGKDF